jgi:hypothetical protein
LDDEAIPEEDTPVSVCACLVSVDSESNVIRLVHHSTREYLERRRISYLPSAQFDIAKTCVTYHYFDTFKIGELPSLEEVKHRMRISPLFKCAALRWGDHAREVLDSSLDQSILDLLDEGPNRAAAARLLHISDHNHFTDNETQGVGQPTSSLWLVAYFGLVPLVKTLLARGAKISASSDLCGTALHAAIQHQYTCQLLIDHGAMCKPVLRMEGALYQKRLRKN